MAKQSCEQKKAYTLSFFTVHFLPSDQCVLDGKMFVCMDDRFGKCLLIVVIYALLDPFMGEPHPYACLGWTNSIRILLHLNTFHRINNWSNKSGVISLLKYIWIQTALGKISQTLLNNLMFCCKYCDILLKKLRQDFTKLVEQIWF